MPETWARRHRRHRRTAGLHVGVDPQNGLLALLQRRLHQRDNAGHLWDAVHLEHHGVEATTAEVLG